MSQKKSIGLSMAILGIVFVVYNLFVFLFLKPVTSVFWMSYVFMILAFLLQILGFYLSFKGMTIQAVFFGIPLAQFTLFYFFAELFMSLVFMIFQMIDYRIPLFLQILLLAVYGVVAVVSVFARDTAVAEVDRVQSRAQAMRFSAVDIEMLRDYTRDPALREQLRRLAETVRYSDPISTDAVADVDGRIYQATMALQVYCHDGDVEVALSACEQLQRLYVERSRKLLASK